MNLSSLNSKIILGLVVAGIITAVTIFWLWNQQPEYRVLFSIDPTQKDGGAIMAALEQMNVPYKIADGGTNILVPSALVHPTRLKIAAMGLPKASNVGFELLENQKFGSSQFLEQVNFQRALEGELEKSIQAITAVQAARVHLAIPKSSVFTHDQQKPTASILVNLHPGRTLNEQQISAIVHLLASSVPELTAGNVTMVDQNGNLLSDTSKKAALNGLDPSQLKYIEDLQQSIIKRAVTIITPLVGPSNVHAEANVEVDFSSLEQADETYKPNQKPEESTIRSQQSNETSSGATTGGVPGALSNQPPADAKAPLTSDPNTDAAGTANSGVLKNVTTNYEVNKSLTYTQKSTGNIKRLTVAIVVNNKQVTDKNGKVSNRPLNTNEKNEIEALAKQAVGFNEARGDSLSVVNSAFVDTPIEVVPAIPLWQNPDYIDLAKSVLKLLVSAIVLFLLYKKVIKPILAKFIDKKPEEEQTDDTESETPPPAVEIPHKPPRPIITPYEQNLNDAKSLASSNPKIVANIVTEWVNNG